jgi:hypothetical protein
MKLPSIKRIDKQNFDPKDKDLIEKLGFTLNNDLEVVFNGLNRNISLKDNVLCTVKDVQIIVDSDGIPQNTASFQLDIQNMRILGCQVVKAINLKNSTGYVTGAPFITFSQASNIININHITGLRAGQTYNLTIIAWGT